MFKNKSLLWKIPTPNFVALFVLIGMTFSVILFLKFELCSNFPETRVFLEREPIRMCEKHHSLVGYMLMIDIYRTKLPF